MHSGFEAGPALGERKWKKVYFTKKEKNAVIYDCIYSRAKDIRKLIKQSGK
jgi:hypothetical protein